MVGDGGGGMGKMGKVFNRKKECLGIENLVLG